MAAIFLPSSPFPQIYSQQTEIVFSTHLHFAMILETFKICFSEKTFSLWQSRLSKEFRNDYNRYERRPRIVYRIFVGRAVHTADCFSIRWCYNVKWYPFMLDEVTRLRMTGFIPPHRMNPTEKRRHWPTYSIDQQSCIRLYVLNIYKLPGVRKQPNFYYL